MTDPIVRELSLARRVGHAVVGLTGLLGAGLIGLLWATEPAPLPARTQAAFAALALIGLTWAGVAAWALARRPLFALDRVVTAGLALMFSTASTAWATVIAWQRGGRGAVLAVAGIGLALVLGSAALLVRARAYRATLLERRRRLEPEPVARDGARTPLPIGPLALALRLRGHSASAPLVTVAALMLAAALVAGVAMLLR
jgi:hypothetical protein